MWGTLAVGDGGGERTGGREEEGETGRLHDLPTQPVTHKEGGGAMMLVEGHCVPDHTAAHSDTGGAVKHAADGVCAPASHGSLCERSVVWAVGEGGRRMSTARCCFCWCFAVTRNRGFVILHEICYVTLR